VGTGGLAQLAEDEHDPPDEGVQQPAAGETPPGQVIDQDEGHRHADLIHQDRQQEDAGRAFGHGIKHAHLFGRGEN